MWSDKSHMENVRPTITAFRDSELALREQYGNARMNAEEFQRKINRCSLGSCRGTCCYGGVRVDDDTARVLQQLSLDRASTFRAIGLSLPNTVVAHTEWRGVTGNITVLKPFPFRSLVGKFPSHFDETACTFLLDDGRCGLQVLAGLDGKHPWYYKPFSCWLLPIKLWKTEIRLFNDETDPFRFLDYNGFFSQTFCGQTSKCGLPAAQVLKPELTYLGHILNRDLVREAVAKTADTGL
jgi:hypothetical protein